MHISFAYAFLAGILSFLSPCVLPLVPGYVSMLSGTASQLAAQGDGQSNVRRGLLLRNSLLFILGFSLVFLSLGAAASSIGHLLLQYRVILGQVMGIVVILFGLHLLGVLKITALYSDKRLRSQAGVGTGIGALVIGIAFALGWTPCIGPVLATILGLAATQKSVHLGVLLLATYTLGLAIPFFLTAIALDRFTLFYKGFRKHLHTVEMVSGGLLVVVGLLLLTSSLSIISGYLSRVPLLSKMLS